MEILSHAPPVDEIRSCDCCLCPQLHKPSSPQLYSLLFLVVSFSCSDTHQDFLYIWVFETIYRKSYRYVSIDVLVMTMIRYISFNELRKMQCTMNLYYFKSIFNIQNIILVFGSVVLDVIEKQLEKCLTSNCMRDNIV